MKSYKSNNIYGYFSRPSIVHVSERMPNRESAQCGVIYYDNNKCRTDNRENARYIDLISYESVICTYDTFTDTFLFGTDCISYKHCFDYASVDFSATTRKHVGYYCHAFCPQHSYQELKCLYYG